MAVWHGSSMFVPVNIVTLHCAKSVIVSRVQVTFAPSSKCLINHLNQLSLAISSQVSRMSNAIVITAKWKKMACSAQQQTLDQNCWHTDIVG